MTSPWVVLRDRTISRLRDYAELVKLRVTTLIVMTAWCGYFFGAHKAGISSLGWGLLHALVGIGLVSSGTAALNEVLEQDVDSRMRRTAQRPIPAGRMSRFHAATAGLVATIGGAIYLGFFTNWLTGLLTFLTSVVYLAAYTPLKRISPVCTFVGAFPGAIPGLDGRARPSRMGSDGAVCHLVCMAVSAFLLDRLAVSRRLPQRWNSHVACSGSGWTIHLAADSDLFDRSGSAQPLAQHVWDGGKNLSGGSVFSRYRSLLFWTSTGYSQYVSG
jgi:UbiA prenyltransferase family